MDIYGACKLLEGRQYRDEEPYSGFFKEMGANNLVAVYGASDDLMEFNGAICDEVDAYDGGTAYLNSTGLIENECDNYECPHFEKLKQSATTIEAIWHDTGEVSWTYKTSIPHSVFTVMEDDEVYCRGIVFSLEDVK
jgi:hypothetical protein